MFFEIKVNSNKKNIIVLSQYFDRVELIDNTCNNTTIEGESLNTEWALQHKYSFSGVKIEKKYRV